MPDNTKPSSSLLVRWKQKVKLLKTETLALYLALRNPRTPWYAKAFTALVVAYAFSPIDLIPDFVPVLGYLDDLILIPLGITIATRLIPSEVLSECRTQAQTTFENGKPVSRTAGLVILLLWIALAFLLIRWIVEVLI